MRKYAFNVRKRGFSLAEAAVAMSLIALVLFMAVTAVLTVSVAEKRADDVRFFVNETENFLECYKVRGARGFTENAKLLFPEYADIAAEGESARFECVICYDENRNIGAVYFYPLGGASVEEYGGSGRYFLRITVDNGYFSRAENSQGEVIFTLEKEYKSRFDI